MINKIKQNDIDQKQYLLAQSQVFKFELLTILWSFWPLLYLHLTLNWSGPELDKKFKASVHIVLRGNFVPQATDFWGNYGWGLTSFCQRILSGPKSNSVDGWSHVFQYQKFLTSCGCFWTKRELCYQFG